MLITVPHQALISGHTSTIQSYACQQVQHTRRGTFAVEAYSACHGDYLCAGDKLAITHLAALQEMPAIEVLFQVPMASLMGLLKHSGLLLEEVGKPSTTVSAHTCVAAGTKAKAWLKARMADPNPRTSTKGSTGKSESATLPAQRAVCSLKVHKTSLMLASMHPRQQACIAYSSGPQTQTFLSLKVSAPFGPASLTCCL